MEFVGISGNSGKVDVERLMEIAKIHGIDVVRDQLDYDREVFPGLVFFMESFKDDFLLQLILKGNGRRKRTTSSLLTEELSDYFIHKADSSFIDFINSVLKSGCRLEGVHLIFASELEDESQNIRLVKTDLEGVLNYFKSNNSWHLVFYNIEKDSYEFEFGCPLVFEIS